MRPLVRIQKTSLLLIGAVAGALALSACVTAPNAAPPPQEPSPVATTAPASHDSHGGLTPKEMADLHVKGVKDFPVATHGKGNQVLEPIILPDGTKQWELTASEIQWETEPGKVLPAMAYNGQVPGPQLRANLGDKVRIILHNKNKLSEPTALHSHGLIVPNAMDGVPGLTQDLIIPGESFTYEYTLKNFGSHMYHSHFSAMQVVNGLLGAIVVADPNDPPVDLDYTMILNDGPLGYTLNGKGFPATEPIVVKKDQTVRNRYMNEGLVPHPMHLHGMPGKVIAKDGYLLEHPYYADTINVTPGERYDVLVKASEVGGWAFHCHILTHAESPRGMFGMVTAFIVAD